MAFEILKVNDGVTTGIYYMGEDKAHERGVPCVQYTRDDAGAKALADQNGKFGVVDLANKALLTIAQGKASGKKNTGKAAMATRTLNAIKDAAQDPEKARMLKALGLL